MSVPTWAEKLIVQHQGEDALSQKWAGGVQNGEMGYLEAMKLLNKYFVFVVGNKSPKQTLALLTFSSRCVDVRHARSAKRVARRKALRARFEIWISKERKVIHVHLKRHHCVVTFGARALLIAPALNLIVTITPVRHLDALLSRDSLIVFFIDKRLE